MVKRKLEESHSEETAGPASKRARPIDRLSRISDELLLRILAHVSVLDLTVCQRVSKRFERVAGDSQLWRTAYYDRFVLPRFHQLPKSRRSPYPTKLTKWLDEGTLVERGRATNWKRQYKLRHKWAKGTCDVKEIPVATRPPTPPLLARLHDGIVYTVDSSAGLRAWSYKGDQRLIASYAFQEGGDAAASCIPTALAIDVRPPTSEKQRLAVGLDDGSYHIFHFDKALECFCPSYKQRAASNGALVAIAYASPYLLSMSESRHLSLYRLQLEGRDDAIEANSESPRLLTSLKSHTLWPPISLSLRVGDDRIVAAIAYCMPTLNSGWSAGVQELHLSTRGDIVESRLASALGHGFSLADKLSQPTPIFSSPTSLSYSHPYLLVSHADNTLTLYVVKSTAEQLSVGLGKRLWGHTSSVLGAHVGGRGKAVSVSTRGNEIRVWELEGSNLSRAGRRQAEELSVQVTPEKTRLPSPVDTSTEKDVRIPLPADWSEQTTEVTRAHVGFDDESVVVLREHAEGRQAFAIYSFA